MKSLKISALVLMVTCMTLGMAFGGWDEPVPPDTVLKTNEATPDVEITGNLSVDGEMEASGGTILRGPGAVDSVGTVTTTDTVAEFSEGVDIDAIKVGACIQSGGENYYVMSKTATTATLNDSPEWAGEYFTYINPISQTFDADGNIVGAVSYNGNQMVRNTFVVGDIADSFVVIAADTENDTIYIDTTSNTDLLINKDGGNVGIGKADPTEKVDIEGNLKVSGTIMGNLASSAGSNISIHSDNDIVLNADGDIIIDGDNDMDKPDLQVDPDSNGLMTVGQYSRMSSITLWPTLLPYVGFTHGAYDETEEWTDFAGIGMLLNNLTVFTVYYNETAGILEQVNQIEMSNGTSMTFKTYNESTGSIEDLMTMGWDATSEQSVVNVKKTTVFDKNVGIGITDDTPDNQLQLPTDSFIQLGENDQESTFIGTIKYGTDPYMYISGFSNCTISDGEGGVSYKKDGASVALINDTVYFVSVDASEGQQNTNMTIDKSGNVEVTGEMKVNGGRIYSGGDICIGTCP